MLVESFFTKQHEPVFCDLCRRLVMYLENEEVIRLKTEEGWQGDMYCDACWDLPLLPQNAVPDALQGDFLGFMDHIERTGPLSADRASIDLYVTTWRTVEIYGMDKGNDDLL